MRKVLLSLLILSPTVFGDSRFFGNINWVKGSCVGDKIHMNDYFYRLSSTVKCQLPIVNAEHMKALHVYNPVVEYFGCWGETLGGNAILMYGDDTVETLPLVSFEEVYVDNSGNGKVIASQAQERKLTKCPR